jgi:hypothetical protein
MATNATPPRPALDAGALTERLRLLLLLTILAIFLSWLIWPERDAQQAADPELEARAKGLASAIVLDLNGEGIPTLGLAARVHFDHNDNGFAQRTGWPDGGTGLLVLDLDGNGAIDSGRELFGSHTLLADGTPAGDGFTALARYDTNGDGRIDRRDAVWDRLRVWRPVVHEGLAQGGTLQTLDELSIVSIGFDAVRAGRNDGQGNIHLRRARFRRADGTAGEAVEIRFALDNARTQALRPVPVPEHIAALPDFPGMGYIHGLHQAMARDESGRLEALVRGFMEEPSATARRHQMEALIHDWVGVADLPPESRGGHIDARRLAVLEASLGEGFVQRGMWTDPRPQAARMLEDAYTLFFDTHYGELMRQTRLRPPLHALVLELAAREAGLGLDVVAHHFEADRHADRARVLDDLIEFTRYGGLEALSTGWDPTGLLVDWLIIDERDGLEPMWIQSELALRGSGMVRGGERDTVIVGGEEDNELHGAARHVLLVGGAGNDTLHGGKGHNVFVPGPGADVIHAGGARSVYILRRGDGANTVHARGGPGLVALGPGIDDTHVRLRREGEDLVLALDTGESLTFVNALGAPSGRPLPGRSFVAVRFADGSEQLLEELPLR